MDPASHRSPVIDIVPTPLAPIPHTFFPPLLSATTGFPHVWVNGTLENSGRVNLCNLTFITVPANAMDNRAAAEPASLPSVGEPFAPGAKQPFAFLLPVDAGGHTNPSINLDDKLYACGAPATQAPTRAPTRAPTSERTRKPTKAPTIATAAPSRMMTLRPTIVVVEGSGAGVGGPAPDPREREAIKGQGGTSAASGNARPFAVVAALLSGAVMAAYLMFAH
jgi:hypothetical protein